MPPLQWEVRRQVAFVGTVAITGKGERQDRQGGDDGEPIDHRPAEWDTTPRRVEVVDEVQDVAESSTAVVGTSFGVRVVGDLNFSQFGRTSTTVLGRCPRIPVRQGAHPRINHLRKLYRKASRIIIQLPDPFRSIPTPPALFAPKLERIQVIQICLKTGWVVMLSRRYLAEG
jgi:hypothetical protein